MVDALPKYLKTTYDLKQVSIADIKRYSQQFAQFTTKKCFQLQEFRDLNIDTLGTAEQAVDRAIELVKANIAWMYQSYASVDKWLTDFNHHY